MKFLYFAVLCLVAYSNALPQRRAQQKQLNSIPQQKPFDQQSQPSDQDFRQPIQVSDFKQPQPQQEYRPTPQEYRQNSQEFNQQNFKARNPDETTTWIPIIKFSKEQETDGSYKTSYETGNNIIAEETGFLKNAESDNPSLVQHGSYTYVSPEGKTITVEYTADEFGFRAVGEHIPTPPPLSPEIQKGLDLIYAGIKANEERSAKEQKDNPEAYAKKQADRAALDFAGQYYHQ